MIYICCPSCRELLGDKQKYYERKLAEICQKYEMGIYKSKEEAESAKMSLVNNLGLRRYCCKKRMITYIRPADIVK